MGVLKQKPLPFSFLVLLVLVVVHLAASYFYWYWTYPWFEVVVHVLGGMWVALVFLWLASCFDQINSMVEYKTKSLLIALIAATIFGIAWELMENLAKITFVLDAGYTFDTAFDLFNDVIGGVLAYLYFIRKKVINPHDLDAVDHLQTFYNKVGLVNDIPVK